MIWLWRSLSKLYFCKGCYDLKKEKGYLLIMVKVVIFIWYFYVRDINLRSVFIVIKLYVKKCEIGVCFIYIIIYGCVIFKIVGFY